MISLSRIMTLWFFLISIFGIIFVLLLIFGLPRKKSKRKHNLEGLNTPEVAEAFERMTRFLPFKLLRRKVVSELKKINLEGNGIDIGCGSGNLIIDIKKKIPSLNLTGVDISSEILDLAKKKVNQASLLGSIEFKIGKVEELPFPDNSSDFILSTLSLHHWINPLNAFNEIYRVLKKNGILLIFDFRRDSRKFFYGLFKFATNVVVPKALKEINEPLGSIQSSYTPKEVIQLFSKTPFENVSITPYLSWMFINSKK